MSLPVIKLKQSEGVEGAVVQIITINCLATTVVNDLVRISEVTPNFADKAANNSDPRPVVGMVIEKLSPTSARVAVSGVIADPDATSPGVLYLSGAGRFTQADPPTPGYVQKLGYSFGNGFLDLKPEKTMIFRN